MTRTNHGGGLAHEFGSPEEHDLDHAAFARHRRAEVAEHNLGRMSAERGTGNAESGSDLVAVQAKFRRDFSGALTAPDVGFLVGEMFDWLAEEGLLAGHGRAGKENRACNFDAARTIEAKCRNSYHFLIAYQEKQKPKRVKPANGVMFTREEMEAHIQAAYDHASMSTRAMALELGYATAAGGDEPAKIARKFGYVKFTFCKCCEKFQELLGLPKRPGQRDEAARKTMSDRRRGQLNDEASNGTTKAPKI